jgi:hypothetical protein
MVSGDEHTASRQKSKNSIRKHDLNKIINMMPEGQKLPTTVYKNVIKRLSKGCETVLL